VIDSYAWIEHFLGTEKGHKVDDILENADEVYSPDTVLAEVARKYVREGVDLKIINSRLEQIDNASNIICLDSNLAIKAAQCYLEIESKARKSKSNLPSLFDAILLAAARSLNAKVLTGDQHFKDLPETLWIG
jgi:predicted nucleic acid-binding protein